MVGGHDHHMGAPSSFTARRPNASNLPSFELPPPPPIGPFQSKYQHSSSYLQSTSSQPAPSVTTLTSVGNLLTPPSNGSADGLSPTTTTGLPSSNSFTPNGSGMWHPSSSTASTPYGFQPGSAPHAFGQGRIFSPSLNALVRNTHSPSASDSMHPVPYEIPQYSQSLPMSAPSLPSMHQPQMIGNAMMGGQHTPVSAPVTQPSPVSAHDSFSRPPPTPSSTYYSHASSTPQQGSFSYSTGPSPISQSPMSAGGHLGKMSPVHQQGQMPSLQTQPQQQQYSQHRPYSYPMPVPVLSNINNPNGQLSLVGGAMHHGMMPAFNSGHAAVHAMYGHHPQQQNAQNDRPFRCDQCAQSFNRNHDLKRHKRIHLAVKPFPCGHCDKSFSRKDALKRHVLVKGCGKAQASTKVKEIDSSVSPKSESAEGSPVMTSTVT